LDFLFGFTEALDLFFNPEKVIDTRTFSLGDFGVAWWWVSEEINVLAFIRNNVFVGIQGFLPKEKMISAAKIIDSEIKKVGTQNRYQEATQGFFEQSLRNSSKVTVPMGERLDIALKNLAWNLLLYNLNWLNEPRFVESGFMVLPGRKRSWSTKNNPLSI